MEGLIFLPSKNALSVMKGEEMNGADLLKILVDLLAEQEQVKITYEIEVEKCHTPMIP